MLREARPMWVKKSFWKMEDFAARAVQEFLLESVMSITRHIMPACVVQEFADKTKPDWKFTIF